MMIASIVTPSVRRIHFVRLPPFACFSLIVSLSLAEVVELQPAKYLAKRVDQEQVSHRSARLPEKWLLQQACRAYEVLAKRTILPQRIELASRGLASRGSTMVWLRFMTANGTRWWRREAPRQLPLKACRIPTERWLQRLVDSRSIPAPPGLRACERGHVESIKNSTAPSLEGVSSEDRALIGKFCPSKRYQSQSACRACQSDQVSQLKTMQKSISARRQ